MRAEDYRIPDRIVLGIQLGNLGGGITEPKLFGINSVIFLCVMVHQFLFSDLIPRKITFQLHKNIFSGVVCDSENYMEKCFGNDFLGKSPFSTQSSIFRINQDTFDHDKGQKSAISWRRLH